MQISDSTHSYMPWLIGTRAAWASIFDHVWMSRTDELCFAHGQDVFRAGLVSLGVQRPQTRWKTKSDLVHVILMVKFFFYAYVLWTPCKVKHLVLLWPSLYLWDKLSMMVIHSMNFPMWCTRFLIIVSNTKHFQIKISNQLAGKKPKAHYFIITIDILYSLHDSMNT